MNWGHLGQKMVLYHSSKYILLVFFLVEVIWKSN